MQNDKRQTALAAFMLATSLHMSEQSTGFLTQTLSWIDPTARGLTHDEIALVQPILGDRVDYGSVRVFERKSFETFWQEWAGSSKKAGTAERHVIYLHDVNDLDLKEASKDGFKGYPNRKLLVHELAHVGQYQSRIANAGIDRDYTVKIEPGKVFTAYKIEQQAMLAVGYYESWNKIRQLSSYFQTQNTPAPERTERLTSACQEAEAIAAAIRPHFPAVPHPACVKLQM